MGKLESLLESTIDNNFDKFELYCLRNIFNIPKDLIPYIQLSHQQGIEFKSDNVEQNVNLINKLKFTIENHARITTSKNLKITTCQSPKLIKVLIAIDNDFKKIDFASGGGGGNEESIRILKNLQPIDETLYF